MIPRKEKSYFEMSPVERYFKYKDITWDELYNLHHKEVQKFYQEQCKKRQEQE